MRFRVDLSFRMEQECRRFAFAIPPFVGFRVGAFQNEPKEGALMRMPGNLESREVYHLRKCGASYLEMPMFLPIKVAWGKDRVHRIALPSDGFRRLRFFLRSRSSLFLSGRHRQDY